MEKNIGRKRSKGSQRAFDAAAGAIGAAAGALVGAFGGPIGAITGGLLGAVIGVAVSATHRNEREEESAFDEQLDRDIGVSGGDLGAASPNQPPMRRGPSLASAGASSSVSSPTPSEGPIQALDE